VLTPMVLGLTTLEPRHNQTRQPDYDRLYLDS